MDPCSVIWLVVDLPLWKLLVKWDYSIIPNMMGKITFLPEQPLLKPPFEDLPASAPGVSLSSAHGLARLCLQLSSLGICQDIAHLILGLVPTAVAGFWTNKKRKESPTTLW